MAKQVQRCGHCRKEGHNRLTCPQLGNAAQPTPSKGGQPRQTEQKEPPKKRKSRTRRTTGTKAKKQETVQQRTQEGAQHAGSADGPVPRGRAAVVSATLQLHRLVNPKTSEQFARDCVDRGRTLGAGIGKEEQGSYSLDLAELFGNTAAYIDDIVATNPELPDEQIQDLQTSANECREQQQRFSGIDADKVSRWDAAGWVYSLQEAYEDVQRLRCGDCGRFVAAAGGVCEDCPAAARSNTPTADTDTPTADAAAPGWYPSPSGDTPGEQMYWDGSQWTEKMTAAQSLAFHETDSTTMQQVRQSLMNSLEWKQNNRLKHNFWALAGIGVAAVVFWPAAAGLGVWYLNRKDVRAHRDNDRNIEIATRMLRARENETLTTMFTNQQKPATSSSASPAPTSTTSPATNANTADATAIRQELDHAIAWKQNNPLRHNKWMLGGIGAAAVLFWPVAIGLGAWYLNRKDVRDHRNNDKKIATLTRSSQMARDEAVNSYYGTTDPTPAPTDPTPTGNGNEGMPSDLTWTLGTCQSCGKSSVALATDTGTCWFGCEEGSTDENSSAATTSSKPKQGLAARLEAVQRAKESGNAT